MKKVFYALIAAMVFSGPVFAHSGGTNAKGCHHERATGGYHCH